MSHYANCLLLYCFGSYQHTHILFHLLLTIGLQIRNPQFYLRVISGWEQRKENVEIILLICDGAGIWSWSDSKTLVSPANSPTRGRLRCQDKNRKMKQKIRAEPHWSSRVCFTASSTFQAVVCFLSKLWPCQQSRLNVGVKRLYYFQLHHPCEFVLCCWTLISPASPSPP